MMRTAAVIHLLAAFLFLASPPVSSATEPAGALMGSWPQWRGPYGTGVGEGNPPLLFSDTKNVKWRVSIPGRGYSTPIVWGDRIFLTTAVQLEEETPPAPGTKIGASGLGGAGVAEHKFVVMAIERQSGKTVWERTATIARPHQGYRRELGSLASNSAVTDGETLFAYFGSRGLYAYDLDGNLKWKFDLPVLMDKRNAFGEGAAPALYKNTIVLTCDHEGPSYILALDKSSGNLLWRRERDEITTWAQPFITEFGGRDQVITSGKTTRAYDLKDGSLIWEARGLGQSAIPTPVRQDDVVLVMSGSADPNLMAIRLGGEGDLTDRSEHILWSNQRGNPYAPSPVLHDGIYYFISDAGLFTAVDALTGKKHYDRQRLPEFGEYKASPVAAGGKLYLASQEGIVTVVKLGKVFEPLATNKFKDELFVSSPVVVGDDLLLRSDDELICLAESK